MGIITGFLAAGMVGKLLTWWNKKKQRLENFDEIIGKLVDPVLIEKELTKLSGQARKLPKNSVYLQMLSQIALMQAVQKKFQQAHATLDDAALQLIPEDHVAAVRILLERGRVFQQAGDIDQARRYFDDAYELSSLHNLDLHTINAAHMLAIIMPTVDEKIAWNHKALSLALRTSDQKARQWLAPIYNNLGQNYYDARDYQQSLYYYEQALLLFEQQAVFTSMMYARYAVARCIRLIGDVNRALTIEHELLQELAEQENKEPHDVPKEFLALIQGFVCEELAHLYYEYDDMIATKEYVQRALQYLEGNEMFRSTSPERLLALQRLLITI